MNSCEHVILSASKGGVEQISFRPAIYLHLPSTLSPKLWFQLQPAHEKLRPKHVLTPQCDGTIDITIFMVLLRSMASIYLSFLPYFLHPHMILILNDQVTCGPPNQQTRSISPFKLWESRFSNFAFSWSISPGVHDLMKCGILESMVTIT
jgi:hypothetical protein